MLRGDAFRQALAIFIFAAQAQAQTQPVHKSSSPPPTSPIQVQLGEESVVSVTSAEPDLKAMNMGGTQTSTTSLKDALTFKQKNLGVIYINWSTVKADDVEGKTGNAHVDNIVGVTYKFTPKISLQVRQPYSFNYPTSSEVLDKVDRGGLQIWVLNSDMGKTVGKIAMSGAIRYYLPTGDNEWSDSGHRGVLAPFMNFTKEFSPKFSLTYYILPYYQFNTQDGKISYTEPGGYQVTGNRDAQLKNWLEADYNLNAKWAVGEYSIYDQTWNRPVGAARAGRTDLPAVRGTRRQVIDIGTNVSYTPNKTLNFLAGIENEHNMDDVNEGRDHFELYRQVKNTYFLITTMTY